MTVVGEAFVEISPDTKGFEREMDRGVGGAITGIAKKAAIAGGAFLAFGKGAQFLTGAVSAASDLEESMSKNLQVFGDWAGGVNDFAAGAADALGQTEAQASAALGTFGNLLRAVGLTEMQAYDMSTSMLTLSADLASFNNADPTEVLDALRAGLTGEAEPLKRFGININAARIEAKALELGLVGLDGEMSSAAKTQATYALIMEDTTLAQGDFARTSGGLANQQRILAARFGDLQARIGKALLPVVNTLVGFLAGPGLDAFEAVIGIVGRLASALGTILGPAVTTVIDFVRGLFGVFTGPGNQIAGVAVEIGKAFGWAEDSSIVTRLIGAFEGVYNILRTIAVEGFGLIRSAAQGYLDFLTGTWFPLIFDVGSKVFDGILVAIDFIRTTVIPGAQQAFQSLLAGFRGEGGEGSFFTDLGEAARGLWDLLQRIGPQIVGFVQDELVPVFERIAGFVRSNLRPILIGLGATLAVLLSPIGALVAGFIIAYQRFEAFRDVIATTVDIVVEIAQAIASTLAPVFAFIGNQVGELARFFIDNFEQIREAVTNVLTVIAVVVAVVLAPIIIFFRTWGDEILEIVQVVWEQIRNVITTAVDLIKGIITLVLAILTGEWGQAWNAILGILSTVWSFIVETIENALQIALQVISGVLGGLKALWSAAWNAIWDVLTSIVSGIPDFIRGVFREVIDYLTGIPGQILGLVSSFIDAGKGIAGGLKDGLLSIFEGATNVGRAFANAIIRFVNRNVIDRINDLLEFNIDLPGPLGSVTVNPPDLGHIPLLAAGAIAHGPTLGVFGEAGREGVLPLPPGLLEGLVAMARDRLHGASGGEFTYAPTLVFPGVTDRTEADAVSQRVNENLAAAAAARRTSVAVRR